MVSDSTGMRTFDEHALLQGKAVVADLISEKKQKALTPFISLELGITQSFYKMHQGRHSHDDFLLIGRVRADCVESPAPPGALRIPTSLFFRLVSPRH